MSKIKIIIGEEAGNFLNEQPLKVQQKIAYNIRKVENGFLDKELFKKLDSSEIWELRTLFNGSCYRLFSFWDTETETLVIVTHGILIENAEDTEKRNSESRENKTRIFQR